MPIPQPDNSFEQAFFQLAYSKLQEKLGNLLPFMTGFEIVNKNPEGTKAVGVFHFQSNSGENLFIPAFFTNGSVQELQILYSRNNDQMYPLTEDFAEQFLLNGPSAMGQPTAENVNKIRTGASAGSDFRDMMRPPLTPKVTMASDDSDKFSMMSTTEEREEIDLPTFLEACNPEVKTAFWKTLESDERFTNAVLHFHDMPKLAKALQVPSTKQKSKGPAVEVITDKSSDKAKALPQKAKSSLVRDGFQILDHRPIKSEVSITKEYTNTFTNPDASGFYWYIARNGNLQPAVILHKPKTIGGITVNKERSLLLNLNDEKPRLGFFPTAKVWVKDKLILDDTKGLLSKLKPISTAETGTEYGDSAQYVLVSDTLDSTTPFRVVGNFTDGDGVRRLRVKGVYEARKGTAPTDNIIHTKENRKAYRTNEVTLVPVKTEGVIETKGSTIYVPQNYKLLPITGVYNENEDVYGDHKDSVPGRLEDVTSALKRKAIYPFTLKSNGSGYFLNVGEARKYFGDRKSTKIAMSVEHGVDAEEAASLVDSLNTFASISGYIKKADLGGEFQIPYEEQPFNNGNGTPTTQGQMQTSYTNTSQPFTDDPTQQGYSTMQESQGQGGQQGIDPRQVDQASQLAQSGQRQIFDAHAMASLTKYVSPHAKISQYLPQLLNALDKLGRILFLFNWETDKFIEMYGRDDLPEFKDLLTNVFKNLGDLVLFLRKKSPELSINMGDNSDEA